METVVECPKCNKEIEVEEWDRENDKYFETHNEADIVEELDRGVNKDYVYYCPRCHEEIDGHLLDVESISQYETNEVLKEYTNMGMILDSPIEEVTKVLEKLGYSELLNFKKMLELQYQQLEYTKNQLLKLEEDTEEAQEVATDIYKLLQKVEDIAVVTEELKEQRKIRY